MCINSDLLIAILNDITSLNLSSPLTIIRPFKVLINWESEIRQRLALLQNKWRELDVLAEIKQEKSATEGELNPVGEELIEREEGDADGDLRGDRLNASETAVAYKPTELAVQ